MASKMVAAWNAVIVQGNTDSMFIYYLDKKT